jgi:hypothetical protein
MPAHAVSVPLAVPPTTGNDEIADLAIAREARARTAVALKGAEELAGRLRQAELAKVRACASARDVETRRAQALAAVQGAQVELQAAQRAVAAIKDTDTARSLCAEEARLAEDACERLRLGAALVRARVAESNQRLQTGPQGLGTSSL